MSFLSCVYQLLIGPIEIFFEYAYKAFHVIVEDYGVSIIFLSLTMNFLLLPLYRRADAIQDAERQQEKAMAPAVAHIKKTFSGDERFMMLQTFYRQNHYKPYYVLKGFLPLVLEIPFFIAAYHFLSNLEILTRTPFRPIADLSLPDGLLHIGGNTYNALPILMTLINCVSSAIYTRGFPLKDKLQLYGMALLFLLILYDSPAALVIYWTTNNLFSLVKNLVGRVKKGRSILALLSAAASLFLIFYARTRMTGEDLPYQRSALIFGAGLLIPLLVLLAKKAWKCTISRIRRGKPARQRTAPPPPDKKQFIWGCIMLALLTGALIPSAVIQSSPEEFVQALHYYSPLRHILYACLLSFGLFGVWFGVFYWMFSNRGKRIFSAVVWVLAGAFIINYMAFETNLGLLSAELFYERPMLYTVKEIAVNLAVLAAAAALMLLIWRKKQQIALWITVVVTAAIVCMAGWNMIQIHSVSEERAKTLQSARDHRAHFTLSLEGHNVIVIMLDRGINRYVPYIFQEYPQLQKQFAGFTYYPNTVSFGSHTRIAAPAIYGGYEYTPDEMNKRSDELISDKHNEALKVLPFLFRDAGYDVTVCDPPYAGYYWIPDLSIFDGEEGITAYNTEYGQFSRSSDDVLDTVWQRNFFCYGLMRCAPLAARSPLYNDGFYGGSQNIHTQFERSYAVLQSLPDMTRAEDGDRNTYLTLSNSVTHEPYETAIPDAEELGVQNPDFTQEKTACLESEIFTPFTLSSEWYQEYYTTNAAALLQIGRWLDSLREMGVYDNTRIIIVSDHGSFLGQFSNLVFYPDGVRVDAMAYNPLLLVKNFGAAEFTMDTGLMSNADVPALALKDLLPDAVNPFTGKPIREISKDGVKMLVSSNNLWELQEAAAFEPAAWYSVHDDMLNPDNWSYLGVH